jgi:hypothetical protein
MSSIVQTMDLGAWENDSETIQAEGSETPIAHSPDDLNGAMGQVGQAAFDFLQNLPSCMTSSYGDIRYKSFDGNSA